VISSRGIQWAGHVTCKEERGEAYRVLMEQPEGKRPVGRFDVVGSVILKWLFKKSAGGAWNLWTWLGSGIDPSSDTKYGRFPN
jgi:hypothetical protein